MALNCRPGGASAAAGVSYTLLRRSGPHLPGFWPRTALREPLLHFLLIGLLLFWLFNVVSGARGGADRRIVVNDAIVAPIIERYQSLWQRPPTDQELRGLLDT